MEKMIKRKLLKLLEWTIIILGVIILFPLLIPLLFLVNWALGEAEEEMAINDWNDAQRFRN